MVFSSTIFLFAFLPATVCIYFLIPNRLIRGRNLFLLLASLFFYAWGEPRFVFIMLLIIMIDYILAFYADRARISCDDRKRKRVVAATIIANTIIFFIFKYLNFSIANLNLLCGKEIIRQTNIALPIGISFMTFQAMSYVFDVLSGKGKLQENPLNVGLYISLFPQLIAGPIVRYQTIADEIEDRHSSLDDVAEGVARFIVGLGKKVIIANSVAYIADWAFDMDASERTFVIAWIGAIAYTLQIYYDFSGYSDMAIGLGRIFGFHFLENFNYPYISKTVTEFWRRWHISLGTWFRDYVYIPMGGSRRGKRRTIINLLVVWTLTGVWHGANWTFVLWGILFFLCITMEKMLSIPKRIDNCRAASIKTIAYRTFTGLVIVCGWVLFRSNTIKDASGYISAMINPASGIYSTDLFHLRQYALILIIGSVFATPIIPLIKDRLNAKNKSNIYELLRLSALLIIYALSVIIIIASTYNPFIYFNF